MDTKATDKSNGEVLGDSSVQKSGKDLNIAKQSSESPSKDTDNLSNPKSMQQNSNTTSQTLQSCIERKRKSTAMLDTSDLRHKIDSHSKRLRGSSRDKDLTDGNVDDDLATESPADTRKTEDTKKKKKHHKKSRNRDKEDKNRCTRESRHRHYSKNSKKIEAPKLASASQSKIISVSKSSSRSASKQKSLSPISTPRSRSNSRGRHSSDKSTSSSKITHQSRAIRSDSKSNQRSVSKRQTSDLGRKSRSTSKFKRQILSESGKQLRSKSGSRSNSRQRLRSRSASKSRQRFGSRSSSKQRLRLSSRSVSKSKHRLRSRSASKSRHPLRSRSISKSRRRLRSRSTSKSRHRLRSRSISTTRRRLRSRSTSKSRHRLRSRSTSKSRRRSRSISISKSRRRSRSRSKYRHRLRSRSKSMSKHHWRSRSKSRRRSRPRSMSRSERKNRLFRSKTRSSSRRPKSPTRSNFRSKNYVPKSRPKSKIQSPVTSRRSRQPKSPVRPANRRRTTRSSSLSSTNSVLSSDDGSSSSSADVKPIVTARPPQLSSNGPAANSVSDAAAAASMYAAAGFYAQQPIGYYPGQQYSYDPNQAIYQTPMYPNGYQAAPDQTYYSDYNTAYAFEQAQVVTQSQYTVPHDPAWSSANQFNEASVPPPPPPPPPPAPPVPPPPPEPESPAPADVDKPKPLVAADEAPQQIDGQLLRYHEFFAKQFAANSSSNGSSQDANSNGKVSQAFGRSLKPHSTFAYFLEKFQPAAVPSQQHSETPSEAKDKQSISEKPAKPAAIGKRSPPKSEEPPQPKPVAVGDEQPKFPGCEPGGPPPPNYEHIESNVYRRSQPKLPFKAWLCDCTLPSDDELTKDYKACTDECMNRLLQIECTDRCNCGSYCTNNRFANKRYAPLTPFYAGPAKGWGLKTTADVPAGAFLIEYVGEVIDFAQFKRRIIAYEKSGCPHHYFMSLESDVIVDAGAMGNWARFANHSCSPNSDIQKWTVGRQQRVGFFALRDIPAGEEVTVDYGFVQYGRELQKCYCNSANCTGVMGSRSQQLQDRVQARDSSARDRQVARLLRSDRLASPDDARCLVRLLVQESLDWDTRMRLVRLVGGTVCPASLQALRRCHAVDVLSSYLRELVVVGGAEDSATAGSTSNDQGETGGAVNGGAEEALVLALGRLPVVYSQHVAQAVPLLQRIADAAEPSSSSSSSSSAAATAARELLDRWGQLPSQPFGGLRIPKKRPELRQQQPLDDEPQSEAPTSTPPVASAAAAPVKPLMPDLPQSAQPSAATATATRRLPKVEFRRLFEAYVAFEDEQRKAAAEAAAAAAAAANAASSSTKKASPADLLNDEEAMDKVIGLLSKFLNYLLSNSDPQCALTEAELLSVAADRRLLGLLEYIGNLDDVSIITDKMELVPLPPQQKQPSEQERARFAEQLQQLVAEFVGGVYASGYVDERIRPRQDQAKLVSQLAQQLLSPAYMEQLMRHTGGCLVLDSAVQAFVRDFVVDFLLQPAVTNGAGAVRLQQPQPQL